MPDTLVEACRTEGQICCGSFVWVIIFLPFCGSPGDPPLPRNPPANACTFESGTLPCRSPVISEARPWRAPLKRDARWIRFCRIRSVRMPVQKATSHQPGARSFQSKNQIGRSGPSRSGSAPHSLSEWMLRTRAGRSREREASGGPTLLLGDLPRPQMLCTEREHLVDCQLKGSGV